MIHQKRSIFSGHLSVNERSFRQQSCGPQPWGFLFRPLSKTTRASHRDHRRSLLSAHDTELLHLIVLPTADPIRYHQILPLRILVIKEGFSNMIWTRKERIKLKAENTQVKWLEQVEQVTAAMTLVVMKQMKIKLWLKELMHAFQLIMKTVDRPISR